MWRIKINVAVDITIERTKPEKNKVRIVIFNEQGEPTTMENIAVDMKRVLTAAAFRTTPSGDKPEAIDGVFEWTADKTGIVGLFPQGSIQADCEVTNIGPGVVIVTCTADADKGTGVRNIVATVEITCLAGEADKLTITVGPQIPL